MRLSRAKTQTPHPVLIQHGEQRAASAQNRAADGITWFAGSMWFVYLHVALFAPAQGQKSQPSPLKRPSPHLPETIWTRPGKGRRPASTGRPPSGFLISPAHDSEV